MTTLKVSEIYPSIQGESSFAGWPCVFIRLTGCPLRCRWCDTEYAFTGGERREIDAIVEESKQFGLARVEVTGGEPLAQPGTPELLTKLADRFEQVLIETAGSHPIADLDPRTHVILDLKAPGSNEVERNLWENLPHLQAGRDELKIVIADRSDYEWAKEVVRDRPLAKGVPVHFSPVFGELEPRELVDWIVEDRIDVHLQLQQHKFIWDPRTKGV
ncbi:MAG: radical SAM protein [Planctomycetota bacterium]